MFTRVLDDFFQSSFMLLDIWFSYIKQNLVGSYLKQTGNISFFSRIAYIIQLLVWAVVCAIFIPIYLVSTLVKMMAYVLCAVFFGICAIAGMVSVLWGIVVHVLFSKEKMAPYSTYALWAWVALGRGKCSLQDFLYGRETHATSNVYFQSPDIMHLLATGHINMSNIDDEMMKRFKNPAIIYHRSKKNISVQQVLKVSEGFLTIFTQDMPVNCLDHFLDNKVIDVSDLFCQDTEWYAYMTHERLKKAHEDNLLSYQEWVGAQQGRKLLIKYFECYYNDKEYDDFFNELSRISYADQFAFPRVIRLSIAQRLRSDSKDIESINLDSENDIVLYELGVELHSSLARQSLSTKHSEYYKKNSMHLMFLCRDYAKQERFIMLQDTTILDRPVLFHLYLFGLLMMDEYGALPEDVKDNIEKFYFIHNALTGEASIQHKYTQDRCDVHPNNIPGVLLSVLTSKDFFLLSGMKKYSNPSSSAYRITRALGITNIWEFSNNTHDMLSTCSNIRILALDYPECITRVLSMSDEIIEALNIWMKQDVAQQSTKNNSMLFIDYLRLHRILIIIGMKVEDFLSQTDPVENLYERIVNYANDDTLSGVWKYSLDYKKLQPLSFHILEKIYILCYEDARYRVNCIGSCHGPFFYDSLNSILDDQKFSLPINAENIGLVVDTSPQIPSQEESYAITLGELYSSFYTLPPSQSSSQEELNAVTFEELYSSSDTPSPTQPSSQSGSYVGILTGIFSRSPTQFSHKNTPENPLSSGSHKRKHSPKSDSPDDATEYLNILARG